MNSALSKESNSPRWLYLIDRSSSEQYQEIRLGLKLEFERWGYRVADQTQPDSCADVILADESALHQAQADRDIAFVIADEDVLSEEYSYCSAHDLWNVSLEIKAIIMGTNITQLAYASTRNLQFSPMCYLHIPSRMNGYRQLVAFYVQLFQGV